MLKSLENFEINCPSYIAEEVKTGNVKIIQLVEFDRFFAMMTYDLNSKLFYIGTTTKTTNEAFAQDDYRTFENKFVTPDTEINLANKEFLRMIDDLT